MEVTLFNCAGGRSYHIVDGELVEGEGGEYIDCKGLPLKRLGCTVVLNPSTEDPRPSAEFVDALALVGFGTAIAPPGTKSAIVKVVERPFVLDPMLPPEELPERGAVVLRSFDADSSYGYKKKYGVWPIEHMGPKASSNMILNPFWVTTWEVKYLRYVALQPEAVFYGVSSPPPPELKKVVLSPLTIKGSDELSYIATLLARSHYWSADLKIEHDDGSCFEFIAKKSEGFWVGVDRAEIIITKDKVLFRDDMLELYEIAKDLTIPPEGSLYSSYHRGR